MAQPLFILTILNVDKPRDNDMDNIATPYDSKEEAHSAVVDMLDLDEDEASNAYEDLVENDEVFEHHGFAFSIKQWERTRGGDWEAT